MADSWVVSGLDGNTLRKRSYTVETNSESNARRIGEQRGLISPKARKKGVLTGGLGARLSALLEFKPSRRQFSNAMDALAIAAKARMSPSQTMRSAAEALPRRSSAAQHFRQIATMIDEGVPPDEALRRKRGVFGDVLPAIYEAGMDSGELPDLLRELAAQEELAAEIKASLRKATRGPLITLALIILGGFAVMSFILPGLVEQFQSLGSSIPSLTQRMLNASNFVRRNFLPTLGVLVGAFILFRILVWKWLKFREVYHAFKLKMPLVAPVIRGQVVCSTASLLGILLSANVNPVRALTLAADATKNYRIETALRAVSADFTSGQILETAFAAHSPPLDEQFESLTRLSATAAADVGGPWVRYAKQQGERALSRADALGLALNPIITVVGSLMAFLLLFSVYGPIAAVYDTDFNQLGNPGQP